MGHLPVVRCGKAKMSADHLINLNLWPELCLYTEKAKMIKELSQRRNNLKKSITSTSTYIIIHLY